MVKAHITKELGRKKTHTHPNFHSLYATQFMKGENTKGRGEDIHSPV